MFNIHATIRLSYLQQITNNLSAFLLRVRECVLDFSASTEHAMSYIEKTLSSEEAIQSTFKLHWMAWLRFVGWIVLAIPTFGITLLVAGYEYLRLKCIEQAVTNKRVVFKKGIISRHSEEMRLGSVETVEIRQSIWGRIFGYATIAVTGRGVSDVQLKWMAQPLEVKRAIEDALHQG